jgi:hypothetical protein
MVNGIPHVQMRCAISGCGIRAGRQAHERLFAVCSCGFFLCCFCWWTEDLHFVSSWLWCKVVMVGAGKLLGMERGKAQNLLVTGVS